MQEFRGVDFYRIDELLSEEEKMVRDSVRAFVSAWDADTGKFLRDVLPRANGKVAVPRP